MGYVVYITEQCREDATKFGLTEKLQKKKQQLQRRDATAYLERLRKSEFYKERFDNFRLIAELKHVQVSEDQVIPTWVLLGIFKRGDRDYDEIKKAPEVVIPNKYKSYTEDEIRTYVEGQVKEAVALPTPLTEGEKTFLYRFYGQDKTKRSDKFILETQEWVDVVTIQGVQRAWSALHNKLTSWVDCADADDQEFACYGFTVCARNYPALNRVMLFGIARDAQEKENLQQKYAEYINCGDITDEQLLRIAKRAYPAYVLADFELWCGIEEEKESNLALSPEESEIFRRVHAGGEGDGFPIFINGRAGSGKSTVLQYLFADYLLLYLEMRKKHPELCPPIFLSCSPELTSRAKQIVLALLKTSPERDSTQVDVQGLEKEIGNYIHEFHTFLLSLVPEAERDEKFPAEKYIDYAGFRRFWEDECLDYSQSQWRHQISPDLAWHVIRTYVKGFNPEEYLTPEEYQDLSQEDKTVTEALYKEIFDRVWGKYRAACEKGDCWDDQDLVRYIIRENLVQPSRSVVFCDEAQDFTRMELHVLWGLSVYYDRDTRQLDLSRIPLAFAGDPLQTLNPTGFRWEAVSAMYYGLLERLPRLPHQKINFNYRDLRHNYRSNRPIVGVCNFIQAYGAAVLGYKNIWPQDSWHGTSSDPQPMLFHLEEPLTWEPVSQQRDIVIIVPCLLNEEKDYVKSDEQLCNLVLGDSDVPKNVFSPSRAKGLEFDRVVLYNFVTDYWQRQQLRPLASYLSVPPETEDEALRLQYFLNQLYVAASRARKRLFIIEGKDGIEQFWRIAQSPTLGTILERVGETEWGEKVRMFTIGYGESDEWSKERGDPSENARTFYDQGAANKDPYILRQAAQIYEELGESTEQKKSLALAAEYEEKYLEAGELYLELGKHNEAARCFWLAGAEGLEKLKQLDAGRAKQYALFIRLAQWEQNGDIDRLNELCHELCTIAERDPSLYRDLTSPRGVLSLVLQKIFSVVMRTAKDSPLRKTLLCHVAQFEKCGFPLPAKEVGKMHYDEGNWEQAVKWLKGIGEEAEKYRFARLQILIQTYEQGPKKDPSQHTYLTQEDYRLLAEEFEKQTRWNDWAFCTFKSVADGTRALRVCQEILRDKNLSDDQQQFLIEQLMDALERSGDWRRILDLALASVGLNQDKPDAADKEILQEVKDVVKKYPTRVRNKVVALLALSTSFHREKIQTLERCRRYLQKVLVESWDWLDDLSIKAAGAAYEKAALYKESLTFYERLQKRKDILTKADWDFVLRRWAKNKVKLGERRDTKSNDTEGYLDPQSSDGKRYQEEAINVLRANNLTEDPDDYPQVSPDEVFARQKRGSFASESVEGEEKAVEEIAEESATKETVISDAPPTSSSDSTQERREGAVVTPTLTSSAAQDRCEFSVGPLRFTLSKKQGKLNVYHTETMDTVQYDATSKKITRLNTSTPLQKPGDRQVVEIEDLKLQFQILDRDGQRVAVLLKDLDITISFSFRPSEEPMGGFTAPFREGPNRRARRKFRKH